MKRRLSIAVVAAIALGSVGSYVAHANPLDASKLPKPLLQNFTGEAKVYRKLMAVEAREVKLDLKVTIVDYKRNEIDWFQALDQTSFAAFLYFNNQAFYSQQTKSRMGTALQHELFAAASVNASFIGANVNDLTYGMFKALAANDRTTAGKDRQIQRQCLSNFRTVNRGDDMEAVFVWNGSGTCSDPTPNAVPGDYFYRDANPRFCFASVIPTSPSSATVLTCGYGVPGTSVSCDINGPLGGGSCSGFASSSTGIFFATGSLGGEGNMDCQARSGSDSNPCAQISLSAGCAPEFVSIPLDR